MENENVIDLVSYLKGEEIETPSERSISSDLSSAIAELIQRLREQNPLPA